MVQVLHIYRSHTQKVCLGPHTSRGTLPRGCPLCLLVLLSNSGPGPEERIRAYCLSLGLEWHFVFLLQLQPSGFTVAVGTGVTVSSQIKSPFPADFMLLTVCYGGIWF